MSTNKRPIHMRVYSLLFWYSLNRQNGQARVRALRGAWRTVRAKWTFGNVVIGNATFGAPDTLNADTAARKNTKWTG